jgi:FolB domain-containing protein
MGDLASMDKILIRDLSLKAIIGTYPEERNLRQDVLFNIELRCDFSRAGRTDKLEDTINYKEVKQDIIKFVEHSEFFLVEALAEKVAEICLSHKGVESVKVVLDKPGALRYARSVAVEIERNK